MKLVIALQPKPSPRLCVKLQKGSSRHGPVPIDMQNTQSLPYASGKRLITRAKFCAHLREQLLVNRDRILLRVITGPNFDAPRELNGTEILKQAEQLASSVNVQNDRAVVLLLLPHSAELFLLQLGLVLKGHVPAILAWPTSRIDPEKYQRNLVHQLSQLPADQLVALPRLAANLVSSLPYPVAGLSIEGSATFEKMFPVAPVREHLDKKLSAAGKSPPGPEALFLQFTGGTTGAQKAVVVTASMLFDQLTQLREALEFTNEDGVASWLPLYHDMGLIACYWMPLWHGAPSVQIGANDWVINPELLLKCLDRYGATFCWLPNFSFSYLAQRREHMQQSHRLDRVRAWINCSEPVRLKSINEFTGAFAEWGVKKDCIQACYAMAETVFAITQSDLRRELRTFPRAGIKRRNHSYSELAFDLIDDVYVSSGRPVRNAEIKIVDADGSACPDTVPGEIYVHTPSLFCGYWGPHGVQTHSLHDTWHATGDYGFIADGELFVIGRFKDIVIIGGNNIVPEDVEAVVNTIEGIYSGRVVAFGVEDADYGTQSLAIVAEVKWDFSDASAAQLEAAIRKLVLTTIGTAPRYVAAVPQRWIVKSTAGKISRKETRERFVRERLTIT
jgi:fatty-acyl-CoA synthase